MGNRLMWKMAIITVAWVGILFDSRM